MIILGIDPGYAITGYGVVGYNERSFAVLDYGVIVTGPAKPMPERLLCISTNISALIDKFKPDTVAVEQLFFNKNVKTALSVGQGRGVAIMTAARAGLRVYEYTPLQVKQAVAGYGRAAKSQMQQMVRVLLGLPSIPKPDDAADALAVAICHAHSYRHCNLDNCR
ncbi:MAG: crossover junction endodeoxyribonuclease RuvC [Clostridiales bacterium]|nr:crossover junction endodeoxyribonuclease RuvC [Clostridiales bacterium]